MKSTAYVSRGQPEFLGSAEELELMVQRAMARNAASDVTGVLIATSRHFAQYLEGPEGGVGEIMSSICADPRHSQVTIVLNDHLSQRRYPRWSLAYSGEARYVDRFVEPLFEAAGSGREHHIQQILALFDALTS